MLLRLMRRIVLVVTVSTLEILRSPSVTVSLSHLETKDSKGTVIGRSVYICDACLFVPKFDVVGPMGVKKFHIRPDTCCAGMCMQCRCDAGKKCLRVPFYVRDPNTLDKLGSKLGSGEQEWSAAKVDSLWSGWANECCMMKNAYRVVYPVDLSVDDKLLLTGSGLLVDLTLYEQRQNDD